jgi:hypothetical protein
MPHYSAISICVSPLSTQFRATGMELDMRDLQASELSFVYGAGGGGKCGCGGGSGSSKKHSTKKHSTKKHSTKKCGSTKKHSTRGGSRCG